MAERARGRRRARLSRVSLPLARDGYPRPRPRQARFIAPIAGVIPTEATAAALVIVGVMMFSLVRDLRWDNTSPQATFATIIVMPVTYSIANGVGVGIVLHTCVEVLMGRRVSQVLVLFTGFFVWYFLHGTI